MIDTLKIVTGRRNLRNPNVALALGTVTGCVGRRQMVVRVDYLIDLIRINVVCVRLRGVINVVILVIGVSRSRGWHRPVIGNLGGD